MCTRRLILLAWCIACIALSGVAVRVAQAAESKIPYHFCTGGKARGCEQPGTGFAVCENLLKMLNAYGAQELPATCELTMRPEFPMFGRPQWQDLELLKNLDLTYALERSTAPRGSALQTMSFAQWQVAFERELASGKIGPELRVSRLNSDAPSSPWK